MLKPPLPLLLAAAALLPQPALAMPVVDFQAGDRIPSLSLGFVSTVGFDQAVNERVSLGLEGAYGLYLLNPTRTLSWAAARMTHRLGAWKGLDYGVTLSGGWLSDYVQPNVGTRKSPTGVYPWAQPALNVSYPAGGSVLRILWGPVITADRDADLLSLWPRLEFALPVGEKTEVTLSSYGAIGWRGFF